MARVSRVLVTGAEGFVGKNLMVALRRQPEVELIAIGRNSSAREMQAALDTADVVVHLAGVNRPPDPSGYEANREFAQNIVTGLLSRGHAVPVLFASSTQASLDNPYGRSKLAAEQIFTDYAARANVAVNIYRFPNLYGKWCRPNYNSAVATFCHNIARDLPISISDESRELELAYIDDVVAAILSFVTGPPAHAGARLTTLEPTYKITLGKLVELIRSFRESRETLRIPDLATPFARSLYATYLSYLPEDGFAYPLTLRTDNRGSLAELLKSPNSGQIFFSTTHPGVTRGNHYHDTKVEKFCVLTGEAVIRFRHVLSGKVLSYPVRGEEARVVDIPPGYTHSIENVGNVEMVVLFWASETFDPAVPDTYFSEVLRDEA